MGWNDRVRIPGLLPRFFIGDVMKVYTCEVCGHVHDESVEGKLEDLPAYANCPECGSDAREVYKETQW
jgi:rubredoxin